MRVHARFPISQNLAPPPHFFKSISFWHNIFGTKFSFDQKLFLTIILTKFVQTNIFLDFFGPIFLSTRIFLDPVFVNTNLILNKVFLDQKVVRQEILFYQKISWRKRFSWQIFFLQKIVFLKKFYTKQFLEPKSFLWPSFCK